MTDLIHRSAEQKIRTITQLQAQGIVDLMVPEIRMLGNGVPFRQANFLIAQENLSDNTVTQPIVVSGTTSSQIQFRFNQTGETFILMSDFTPATESSVTLTSTNKVYEGDEIYITNSTVGLNEGFWGVVESIDSGTNTVTFASGSIYSPDGEFPEGSLFEVVPIITYTSAANFGGISRNDGAGSINLAANAQFALEYLNDSGDPITLPLEASSADPFPASAIQNVKSIKITIQVKSTNRMSNGEQYVATAEQIVSVRNLNYKY